MWPFKKKPFRLVYEGIWGHLVSEHQMDGDTLTSDARCVERRGDLEGGAPVTFLGVFRLSETEKKGVSVSGWETFDEHPNLIAFQGYLTNENEASLTAVART